MAIDLEAIKRKLNQLQTTGNRQNNLWKPEPGKQTIRIVPYQFDKENPFQELYFRYDLGKKNYLSPITYGKADPVVEFSEKLKPLWLLALDRPESELQRMAADTIALANRSGMPELLDTADKLIALLEQENVEPVVRNAAARALVTLNASQASEALRIREFSPPHTP